MTAVSPADEAARQRALDITHSVIVQAPAGSGKTSLLTMRFLKLLTIVDAPEEIVAVTFTRKAAAEMRGRIVDALDPTCADDLEQVTEIANAVRQRDRDQGWQLVANPNRLRIQTIDALSTALTRQLPWTSGFGAPPRLAEDADAIYRQTVRRFLGRIDDENDDIGAALKVLLTHFDNDAASIERMLVRMLAHRDQWGDKIVGRGSAWRAELEQAMTRLIEHRLGELDAVFGAGCELDLGTVAATIRFAAQNIDANANDKAPYDAARLRDIAVPLGIRIDDFPIWKALADLALTKDGKVRKALNKTVGFVAKSAHPEAAAQKAAMVAFLDRVRDCSGVPAQLNLVRRLKPSLNEQQWALLESLLSLLPQLLAELHVSFVDGGVVDYTEISLRAVRALEDADGPTELALRLDHRVSHLLVDEFQDTSSIHFNLIAKLTRGWMEGDGRTLFLVGDPMQSIYRFRKADVQLFLNVWERGVGDIALDRVNIDVNFRSEAPVVAWVNASFATIFPKHSNPIEGAVQYARSTPFKAGGDDQAIYVYPQPFADGQAEANSVVEIVRAELASSRNVAILIRNRNHLSRIVPALQAANIAFQGLELVALWDTEIIQDLFALARAAQHPDDRIAWLAVLRAPWCGLPLVDLARIVAVGPELTVIECLREVAHTLSERNSAERVLPLLENLIHERRRAPLRTTVEDLWVTLGGPACVDEHGLENADRFFDLVDDCESGAVVADMGQLEAELKKLYASPRSSREAARVQIMTIFKAKGLEFDTVVLPALGARARADDPQLVRLTEVATGSGTMDFLIAPRERTGDPADPLFDLSKEFDRERGRNESDRLLYVACTRAKERLFLLGAARYNERIEEYRPEATSLLARLWPVVADAFDKSPESTATAEQSAPDAPRELCRLPADWQTPPGVRAAVGPATETGVERELVEYSWAGEEARQLGIVAHDALHKISEDGVENWTDARIRQESRRWRAQFRCAGASQERLDALVARTESVLSNTLRDQTGQWILGRHSDAHAEYRLTAVVDGIARQFVVDRTFVDVDDVRWVIDYKTSRHAGGNLSAFIESERARYLEQMTSYGRVFAKLEPGREIRLGLYFPLLRRFVDWRFDADDEP